MTDPAKFDPPKTGDIVSVTFTDHPLVSQHAKNLHRLATSRQGIAHANDEDRQRLEAVCSASPNAGFDGTLTYLFEILVNPSEALAELREMHGLGTTQAIEVIAAATA